MDSVSLSVDWSQLAKDWGTMIATVVLVAVTTWYVAVTISMAKAAAESANNSRDAADAALSAASAAEATAAAAIAGLKVDYSVSVDYFYSDTDETPHPWEFGVYLTATGATTFVHSLVLNHAMRPVKKLFGKRSRDESETVGLTEDIELQPEHFSLPTQLHAGERIHFTLPSGIADAVRHSDIASMLLTARYSLTPDSPVIPRRLELKNTFPRPK